MAWKPLFPVSKWDDARKISQLNERQVNVEIRQLLNAVAEIQEYLSR